MTNKDFILKLIKYCCFGFLLFGVFMLSFCSGYYYRDSGHTMHVNAQSVNVGPADTVVSYDLFTCNNIVVPSGLCYNSSSLNGLLNKYGFLGFQFRIFSDGNNISCSYKVNSFFYSNVNVSSDDLVFVDIYGTSDFVTIDNMSFDTWVNLYNSISLSTASEALSFIPGNIDTFPDLLQGYRFPFFCFCENGFISDVAAINIFYADGIAEFYKGVEVNFVDVNGKRFRVHIPCLNSSVLNNILEGMVPSRTILIEQDLSDNSYYVTGYDNGYSSGVADGRSAGYNTGYNVGFTNGDLVGYQRGIQDNSQYTFLNLIGAVIDAPITAFVNLLDFNVFGFNMLNLCCSLLTLSLIILVVKFVLFRS